MRVSRFLFLCVGLALAACGSDRKGPPLWNPDGGGPPPRDENFHGGPNATLLKYDANHDGTLTHDELMAGLKAEFAAADKNNNGCLDSDEVAAINAQRIAADQSTATPIVDWNHDGCVDFEEYAGAPLSLFVELDKNADGKVTPQEFDPHAKPKAAQPSSRPATGNGAMAANRRRRNRLA